MLKLQDMMFICKLHKYLGEFSTFQASLQSTILLVYIQDTCDVPSISSKYCKSEAVDRSVNGECKQLSRPSYANRSLNLNYFLIIHNLIHSHTIPVCIKAVFRK